MAQLARGKSQLSSKTTSATPRAMMPSTLLRIVPAKSWGTPKSPSCLPTMAAGVVLYSLAVA